MFNFNNIKLEIKMNMRYVYRYNPVSLGINNQLIKSNNLLGEIAIYIRDFFYYYFYVLKAVDIHSFFYLTNYLSKENRDLLYFKKSEVQMDEENFTICMEV